MLWTTGGDSGGGDEAKDECLAHQIVGHILDRPLGVCFAFFVFFDPDLTKEAFRLRAAGTSGGLCGTSGALD